MTPLAINGQEARGTALEARRAAQAARRLRAANGDHARAYNDAARRAAMRAARDALAARDHGTSAHSDDVVLLCHAIAHRLGIRGEELQELLAAAQLHDVGKVAVPGQITNKPGPLDEVEWRTMRQHTVVAEEILSSVRELRGVAAIVRSCHERYDGEGYPDGLAGEAIPLAARVVFCADAFHAMRDDRPYRRGRSAARAMAEIRRNSGTQFDPRVVDALEEAARELRQAAPDRIASLSAPLRSRRLMALLLTMMVGGSTLAAAGLRLPIPFTGSGEPDAPAVAPNGCRSNCTLDLGGLGRMPGATTGRAAAGELGAGAPLGTAGFEFRDDGGGPALAPGADGLQPRPKTGDPSAPKAGGQSGPATGENGGLGGAVVPGEEAPASDPGGGSSGEHGGDGGSESHGSDPGLLEGLLPEGTPDLPVRLPDLPVRLPELPVRVPELPVEVPPLPVPPPRLPKLPLLP